MRHPKCFVKIHYVKCVTLDIWAKDQLPFSKEKYFLHYFFHYYIHVYKYIFSNNKYMYMIVFSLFVFQQLLLKIYPYTYIM